jgi:hypothetical protein
MAAKLKVFTWSDGFHAYTVAATSRVKALAAWGVTRDLFKDGDASEIAEGADHDAALAKPGETIRRGLTVDVGKISPAAKPKAPNKADAARVDRLTRDLEELTAAHDAALADIEDRRSRLDQEAAELDRAFREHRDAAGKALAAARRKARG